MIHLDSRYSNKVFPNYSLDLAYQDLNELPYFCGRLFFAKKQLL